MVKVWGVNVETQTCYVQGITGHIKVQLWEGQARMLLCSHSYQMQNLSTREYLRSLFLSTTRSTEIQEEVGVAGAS